MFLFPNFQCVGFIQSDVSQLENRLMVKCDRLSLSEFVGSVMICGSFVDMSCLSTVLSNILCNCQCNIKQIVNVLLSVPCYLHNKDAFKD